MNYTIKQIDITEATNLLVDNNLTTDELTTYTVGIFDNNLLIGTGTIYNNIIKLLAVDKNYRNENILSIIVTHLIKELANNNIYKYFIFTTPDNITTFTQLGFSLISKTSVVAYLENNFYPITEKLANIASSVDNKQILTGAVVMNCNPITNGHLYLIEQAKKQVEHLIIFLVEEDKSVFPFKIRKKLVKEATSHLKNITILPSTEYIISSITFPSYFIKDLKETSKAQMKLDSVIFNDYFIPIFNINKRFVGSEPVDLFTANYNQILQQVLKDKLIIINRLTINNEIVSASLVRKHFKEGNFEELKPLVPKSTYEFLNSNEGKNLLKWTNN